MYSNGTFSIVRQPASLHTIEQWIFAQAEEPCGRNPLNYYAYNFIKIHRTFRMSPAMAAGVTDRLWEVAALVALWESYERRAERAA